jgi:hypothetical protein
MPSQEDQEWDIEEDSSIPSFSWNKYKGKTVVLVESDNPWYVNKDITVKLKVAEPQELQDLKYKAQADYKTNIIIPNNEYQKISDCCKKYIKNKSKNLEHFDENNKNIERTNQILFYLCVILLALFIFRYYKNRK